MKKLLIILFYLPILFFGQESIRYVENNGQWNNECLFKADLNNGDAFFLSNSIRYNFYDSDKMNELHKEKNKLSEIDFYSYDLIFLNSNLKSKIISENIFDGYYNYLIGSDKRKWKNKVKSFKSINYSDIYAGIDCRFYSNGEYLKYDFIIKPKSDFRNIVLKYSGVEIVKEEESILIDLGFNKIYESEPYAYQIINNEKIEVNCRYIVNNNHLSFDFPDGYNNKYELIIDPILITATLSGSMASDTWGHSATYDTKGNIYTGARCFSAGYPTSVGAYQLNFGGGTTDIAISKLDSSGSSLIWATYLGGSGNDYPHSLIVNSQNELCVYGSTTSSDYPTLSNSFDSSFNGGSDIIISHLDSLGASLLGSSYFGGSSNDGLNSIVNNYGDDFRGEIMVDIYDNIFIASFSSSSDFPTTSGVFQQTLSGNQDGVVFKVNSDVSSLLWSTFIGGSGNDAAYGIRVDNDYVYFTGTASIGFPITSGSAINTFQGGSLDGYVAKFNSLGTVLEASSFFGSSSTDQSFFIDLDKDSSIYIYGQNGAAISNTSGCYGVANSSQFVAKFNNNLSSIDWQTSIGSGSGSTDFVPTAFLVDVCNKIYISGHGGLNTIPSLFTTPDALYTSGSFYLMQLSPNAVNVDYATHFTGNHVDGGTSRFDPLGRVYQAVCSCPSISGSGMTTTSNAFSSSHFAPCDIGVFKLDFETAPTLAIASSNPASGAAPLTVAFVNSGNGTSFFWDFDDNGSTSTLRDPIHTFPNPGTYYVQLIAIDSSTCNIADTLILPVVVTGNDFSPNVSVVIDSSCNILTDLTITLAQDSGEVDIDSAIFISNLGSFNLSSINVGDTIGLANMTLSLSSFSADLIVDAFSSPSLIVVKAVDQLTTAVLGTFTLANLVGSGIEIIATSPNDGNNFTNGNTSLVTFNEIFQNPSSSSTLIFDFTCISELGSIYNDSVLFSIVNCIDINVAFSNPSCFSYNDGFFNLSGLNGTGLYNYQLQIYDSLLSLWIPIGQSPISGNYTSNPISFINLFSACYKLIIEDDSGNNKDTIICLLEPDEIIAFELITHATPILNNDGSIEIINILGGNLPFVFSWTGPNSFTSNAQDIFNLESGIYNFTITDSNNCIQSYNYQIDQFISGCMDSIANNYDPNATFDDSSCCYLNFYEDNIILCLGDSVELLYSNLGGYADSYLWSTGNISPFLYVNPIVDSTYYLEITYNGNICRDSVIVSITCLEFSPSVSVSLSNLNCSLTDLTINVSQDPNEIDMDSAVFTSDAGSFIISSMNLGDNIGYASMNIGLTTINANLIVSNIISTTQIEVEAINQITNAVLGTFLVENLIAGGAQIISTSPGDGNSYTLNGNSSSITFVNIFDSPDSGFLNFTSSIDSELGDNDVQYFTYILNCTDFSPSVSVSLSTTNCDYLSDLTITVSQDLFEVDMDTATFMSDGGFFLLSTVNNGDTIGTATMSLNLSSFNTDLIVSNIISSNEITVEAIDQLTGAILGSFTLTNVIGGGIKIMAVSPDDGNLYTNGNFSSITFVNLFQTPDSSSVIFSSNIISELGDIANEIHPFLLNCQISPTVSVLLSDLNCGLTDLTIVVSQDSNEVDIDTAFFISDGGFFVISSMNIGDNIGFADMILSSSTLNADLLVNNIVSPNELIVEAIDQITGAILGTFTIINLPAGGVKITATSPDDGNSFTSGHISTVTFLNVFQSPLTGFLNFTSIIISEIGDVDTQVFSFILACTDFSPNVSVSLSGLNCGVLADLIISVSQDSNEVDMDTAIFISDGGSFTLSSMSLGDTIGSASMILYLDSYSADIIVSNVVGANEVIVEAVDQLTGLVLGTFIIKNLVGGGIEIIAISPGDGNVSTNGNFSVITFNNVFTTSSSSLINFTSSITSELGQFYTQSSSSLFPISTFSNNVITSCDNYIFNGISYDSSGIYTDTLTNALGCDSVVIIDLTINNTKFSIDTVLACDSYIWNGITYDTSGTYYYGGRTNNYSMSFDGIDDHVNLNSNPSYAPTNSSNFTISLWVNPSISHEGMIVSQYENIVPTNSNYFLAINSNNSFRVAGDGTNYYDFGSANIGNWQYVTLVFYSSGSVDAYIDGVLIGSSPLNLQSLVSTMPLEVGDIFTGGCVGCIEPFNGSIDNIETWNIALSQQEIQDNMLCSPIGNENNLIGYWNFEEGIGNTVYDLSPNVNHGVVNGSIYNSDYPIQSCSLTASNGCDSIAILDLTINYSSEIFDTIFSCDSLFWNGITYDTSGTYSDTLLNIYGCDSIVNIDLTINDSSYSIDSLTSCDSLVWNGRIFYSSGIYDTTLVNVAGCDSFAQLYLTILPTVYHTFFDSACGNYLFNGIYLDSTGIYYDTVSASSGCDSIITLNLIITPKVTVSPIITQVGCFGDSTGVINLNITSGTSPYTIQWSNGEISEEIFDLYGDSLYTFNIVDSAGCNLDSTIFMSQPGILSVTESITNVSCYNGNDGSISLNIIGGITPYTVDWGSLDTNNLLASYYTYTVSDSNGCIVNDSVLISQPNPITVSVVAQNIQCFGQPTGFIEISVNTGSGVPGYTYEWTGPLLFSSTNDDIYNLFAGNYNLIVTDANSCEFDTIITLTQPINLPQFTNIQISDYSGFNIRCKGDNSGWVSVQVNGGYEPYTYLWSNFSTSDSIYNLSVGTYTLEVTDSIGCIIIFDFPLIEPAEVLSTNIIETTDYNGYNVSCYGFNDAALLGIANGGVPDYTYFWNSIVSDDSIFNLPSGNFELTVYDKNDCISSSTITLIQPDSLYMNLFSFTDTCSKGVGRAEANVYGGVNPYNFNWSSGDNSSTVSNFNEGIYSLIVTDDNLCQISDSVLISNLPSPIIDFGILPDNQRLFDQLDDPIVFVDYTNGIWQDIIQWIWDYDNGSFGSDSISYHSFSDTGTYVIMLTTISEYNCIDTLTKILTITDYNLYIPNAFTPFSTNDELNEVFKAYGIGITDFKMEIFDRWGGRLFTSNSLDAGWDGTTKNGNQVPVGIYIYLIEAVNIYGENFKYHGQVKLIR